MQWVAEMVTKVLSFTNTFGGSLQGSSGGPVTPQQATVFALIYGIPLLSYSHLASSIESGLGAFKTNTFYHQQQLASAGFSDINRPNVDTLYSEALVDLSTQDLTVTIPDNFPADRFYVFPFYDVYGNNVANLGTVGSSSASGSYRVHYSPGRAGYESGSSDDFVGTIYLPTPYGTIDLRIQVNGPDDVSNVTALQTQFELTPGSNHQQIAPSLTANLLSYDHSASDPEKILQLTAKISQFCLPEVASDIARVTATLRNAGLSRGSYIAPSGVDLPKAGVAAIKEIATIRHADADKYFRDLGRNSGTSTRAISRAALYPFYDVTGQLTSDASYTLTFCGKPPVKGFWSVTVYNETAYLIDNPPWNIYSLGDRSSLKYPDGELVYGPDSPDNEFTILLQSLDYPPPESYQSKGVHFFHAFEFLMYLSWIPTPSQNGSKASTLFNFNLRWYGPTEALLLPEGAEGAYVHPVVKKLTEPITEA